MQHWTREVFLYPIYAPEILQYFKPVSLDISGALENAMPWKPEVPPQPPQLWMALSIQQVHQTWKAAVRDFFLSGDLVGGFIVVSCELFCFSEMTVPSVPRAGTGAMGGTLCQLQMTIDNSQHLCWNGFMQLIV